MSAPRTSATDPLRVDFVAADVLRLQGRLGMTFAPGKHGGPWRRDLDADVARLRDHYRTDLLLCLVEDHPFDRLLFETVSAFATVGLSTGITPSLSVPGKLLVTLTMLIGRVGPLTLAVAFASPGRPAAVTLPEERVLIG